MDSAPYRALQAPVGDERIDSIGYLSELCHSISQSKLRHRQIELTFVAGSPLKLPVGQCWRLGMIVSEFIANVAKHAFVDGPGSIRVELFRRGTFVACSVTDNGCQDASVGTGQGLSIVQALVRSLHGEIDLTITRRGAAVLVTFPLQERDSTWMVPLEGSHLGELSP